MMGQGPDDQTIQKLKAFGELLAGCHRDLFAFIYALVQHHADAEDIYQQVTIVLWEKFEQFELGTNFQAWAFKVAHLTALDFMKRRRRNAILFSNEVLEAIATTYNGQKSWGNERTTDALASCLGKLSDRDRDLVHRCYSDGSRFASIAKEENRSIDAIYQAISRIRKNLYLCVQKTLAKEAY